MGSNSDGETGNVASPQSAVGSQQWAVGSRQQAFAKATAYGVGSKPSLEPILTSDFRPQALRLDPFFLFTFYFILFTLYCSLRQKKPFFKKEMNYIVHDIIIFIIFVSRTI